MTASPSDDRRISAPPELLRAITALDGALARQPPIEEPMELWRVWATDVARIPGGGLFVGDLIRDLGFCDCSLFQGHAMSIATADHTLVRILVPVGARMMPLWWTGGPDAAGLVFLPRGTRFRVESFDEVEGWAAPVLTVLMLLPGVPDPEPVGEIALSLPREQDPPPAQIARIVWAADEPDVLR
ncbi:MAG: hypothetical protein WC558_12265 [Patulibacter sp.]